MISAPSAPAIGTTSIVWNGSVALVHHGPSLVVRLLGAQLLPEIYLAHLARRGAREVRSTTRSSSGHFWRARPARCERLR